MVEVIYLFFNCFCYSNSDRFYVHVLTWQHTNIAHEPSWCGKGNKHMHFLRLGKAFLSTQRARSSTWPWDSDFKWSTMGSPKENPCSRTILGKGQGMIQIKYIYIYIYLFSTRINLSKHNNNKKIKKIRFSINYLSKQTPHKLLTTYVQSRYKFWSYLFS